MCTSSIDFARVHAHSGSGTCFANLKVTVTSSACIEIFTCLLQPTVDCLVQALVVRNAINLQE